MAHTSQGGVPVSWTPDEFERWLSGQVTSRSVTTDNQWSTAIDGLTSAQLETLLRMMFKRMIKVG